MLLAGDKYLNKVSDLIKNSKKVRIAVAFWGAQSESLFEGFLGEHIQIICNISMGGSNPAVIEKLMNIRNIEIRQLDRLHAKLVLSEKELVIGSANMSANGLCFEGKESDNFFELGIYSTDSSLIKEALVWFDGNWNRSRSIDERGIELAAKLWSKRRGERPCFTPGGNEKALLAEIDPVELEDRPIYFVMFRERGSEEATEYLDEIADREEFSSARLDVYEGWGNGQLPRSLEDIILPIYIGARGRTIIYSPQRPLPELRKVNDNNSLDVTAIMEKSDYTDILPFRFSNKDRQDLAKQIRTWFDTCLAEQFESNEKGLTKSVGDFLKFKKSK